MKNEFYDLEIKHLTDFQEKSTYEACRFSGLDLTVQTIKGSKFIDCTFDECNLSNCSLVEASLQGVRFENCKLLGLQFEHSNPFGFAAHFNTCLMKHVSFYQMNLQNCGFDNCDLEGADFTESIAKGVSLKDCNLLATIFDQTDLRDAVFTGAQHLELDPQSNQIQKAKMEIHQLEGLLLKYQLDIIR